ncbi:hypothetical protein CDAR_31471 [Caerostris darwini]|uniref:Uncharacterized protein n=1 Tax=Caerostris darwini TaxID=1538125 RepID=A0AAV4QE32_9ARAC|nr:hypothetical protein CDAR_31471 [Caerostris darwini]
MRITDPKAMQLQQQINVLYENMNTIKRSYDIQLWKVPSLQEIELRSKRALETREANGSEITPALPNVEEIIPLNDIQTKRKEKRPSDEDGFRSPTKHLQKIFKQALPMQSLQLKNSYVPVDNINQIPQISDDVEGYNVYGNTLGAAGLAYISRKAIYSNLSDEERCARVTTATKKKDVAQNLYDAYAAGLTGHSSDDDDLKEIKILHNDLRHAMREISKLELCPLPSCKKHKINNFNSQIKRNAAHLNKS